MNDAPAATSPTSPGALTLEDARLFLEQHVRTTTWGRRGLAARLDVTSFERSGAFDVVFQSYTETRVPEETHEPYAGGPVDGPANGRAPGPWEILLQMPPLFTQEHRVIVRVPHTDEVRTCYRCTGAGRVTCSTCSGGGRVICSHCGGDGRTTETRTTTETDAQGNTSTRTETYTSTCSGCWGSGRVTCATCGGSGKVTCGPCAGLGRLCHFRRVHVCWSTRTNSRQIEKTDLPDELVGLAGGDVIHSEEEARIEPGRGGEGGAGPYRGAFTRVNADVEVAANALIASHVFPENEKLHGQRLVVRAVPVYEARYRWGKETRTFWVFGTDRRVHAPRYPVSPWRVGGAVLGGVSVPAALVGANLLGQTAPPPPPVPESRIEVVAPPVLPEPPPIPAPPPPPPELVKAKGPRPNVTAGKTVIELRTDPPGLDVFVGGKKLGVSPLWITIPSKGAGPCKQGKCALGRCTDGACESVTKVEVRGAEGARIVEVAPSDGDLVELR
ncbi:hypothetical protein [Polyangium jinanense]|uniref:CR-type domain-containing protein n=1 Tax=Polyangium jinanense TaxID=2829994 RepID=A0A9X3WXE3_9BACT|nr:hypothetical protein [Polyangium jinanense]MDC3960364.1 hypothetical protein [Polyangium jinanense]MDC3978985.1 hypothetical protein [Polyangium jinanense]